MEQLKDSFWGDTCGQTRLAWKKFWEAESERARDSYLKLAWHERCEPAERRDYRNGYYLRDIVTRFGTIRLRIARTRSKKFLPRALEQFQRRAEDGAS